jgi:hypothetical protein
LRPGEWIADDRVPEILHTLREPTFVTIDADFCDRAFCHPSYCILFFDLSDDDQEALPRLLRTLLRRKDFRSRAARMGKVVRVGKSFVAWWQVGQAGIRRQTWDLLDR